MKTPTKIRPEDIVGVREIADEAGVSRAAVFNWRTRHHGFPNPIAELASGPLFWWPAVSEWLNKTGRLG